MDLKRIDKEKLDNAYEAADYLCKVLGFDHVDPTYAKLDTLRMDISAEREERRKPASS